MRNQERRPSPSAAALLLCCCGLALTALTGGCAKSGRDAIPDRADELASGDGDRIAATVPRSGKAYVLDKNHNKVVWSGNVDNGDKVVLLPKQDRIEVGGRTASESKLDDNHTLVIYFDRK